MRKTTLFILAFALFFSFSFGQTESRSVGDFTKVSISGSFSVYLEKGNSTSVKLDLNNISSDKIITTVEGNTLVVKQKNVKWNTWKNASAKIYITYRDLEEISNGGSGNLRCDTELEAASFRLRNSGSGNVYLTRLDVGDLDAGLSGSANLTLAGKADDVTLSVSGSGNVKAFELETETVSARVSGSGNLNINASEDISASVSGSGNIRYKGNATISNMRTSGSGSIRKV